VLDSVKLEYEQKKTLIASLDGQLKSLATAKEDLATRDNQLKSQESEIQGRVGELGAREQNILTKETMWGQKETVLLKALEELKSDKSRIEEAIMLGKGELKALSDEWDKRVQIFLENRRYVQNEMKRISQLKLEDMSVLQAKEDELHGLVGELEDDRETLRDEEDSVIKKIAELTRVESRVKSREKNLADWEIRIKGQENEILKRLSSAKDLEKDWQSKTARINRVKELSTDLPGLEAEYTKYADLLGKAKAKLMASGIKIQSHPRRLAEREDKIRNAEATLAVKSKLLASHEEEIKHEEEMLHKEEGELYSRMLSREVSAEIGTAELIPPHSDVYDVIQKANSALQQGNLDTATRFVAEAEVMSEKLAVDEKRLLSYDIKELKANIKLAALG